MGYEQLMAYSHPIWTRYLSGSASGTSLRVQLVEALRITNYKFQLSLVEENY